MTMRFHAPMRLPEAEASPSERDRLRAQLQAARAKHKPTKHILDRLCIVTTDELRRVGG
jgi:hypothetical protein